MSNAGHNPPPRSATKQADVRHVEQGNHQRDEPFPSSSRSTLVFSDFQGHSTQDSAPMPEHDHDRFQLAKEIGTHPPEGDSPHLHGSFSQDTLVSSDNYRLTKLITRKPVPVQEERVQYLPIQQNDIRPTDRTIHRHSEGSSQLKGEAIVTPFAIYGLALLVVFFGSLSFWVQSRRRTIFFSEEKTKWMFANPKATTMLWTSVAAILAWCTLWLHACAVSLMARKLIIRGAKISTIECWVKLSSNGAMLDRRRPFLSLYTALAAITTAALTVGFTALLTPVSIVRFNQISGAEIDITRSDFKAWYADKKNRTFTGCEWHTFKNPGNGKEYTFPTCPFQDDNSLVLQAGRVAVETGFGLKSITKVGDVNFNGTTSGVLPIGINGFQAFDTMSQPIGEAEFPIVYNYSTLLQGSTIDVSCEETDSSPITEDVLATLVTTAPNNTNMHMRYNFSSAESGGRCEWGYQQDFIVPAGGNLMSFMCGTKNETSSEIPPGERLSVSPFYIFFRPFGDYESGNRGLQLRNITCKLEPLMTINNVTYNSVTNDFTSQVVEVIRTPGIAPTDFESMDAIYQVFWFGISKQGNIVADTIVSLRHQNADHSSQPMSQTFENILKGFYEIEMSLLRVYYSANFPPGSRSVMGQITHFRMGYNGPIEALYALGPLTVVVAMGVGYLIWGLWVGGEMFDFNPTRASSLLVASGQGGLNLQLGNAGATQNTGKYLDEVSLHDVEVKFGELGHGILGLGILQKTKNTLPLSQSRGSNV